MTPPTRTKVTFGDIRPTIPHTRRKEKPGFSSSGVVTNDIRPLKQEYCTLLRTVETTSSVTPVTVPECEVGITFVGR